jgi:hypothetical protein
LPHLKCNPALGSFLDSTTHFDAQPIRDLQHRFSFCTSEWSGTWLWRFGAWADPLVGELVDPL